jgi:hypothetical protein
MKSKNPFTFPSWETPKVLKQKLQNHLPAKIHPPLRKTLKAGTQAQTGPKRVEPHPLLTEEEPRRLGEGSHAEEEADNPRLEQA